MIGASRRSVATFLKQGKLEMVAEYGGQLVESGPPHFEVPGTGIERYSSDVAIASEHSGRRFRAPTRQAWISVGAISYESEIVWDRGGWHAELRDDASRVCDPSRAWVEQDDAGTLDALGEILVRGADDTRSTSADALAVLAAVPSASSASNSTIGHTNLRPGPAALPR